jgi:hypothetical protein
VRQLTAVAGDGSLGFSGSPGQLETSLNSGYSVGPCNSYLEGPTLVFCVRSRSFVWACCSRNRARFPPPSSSLAEEERPCSLRFVLLAPLAEAGAHEPLPSSLASQTKGMSARSLVQASGATAWLRAAARDLPTLEAAGQSISDAARDLPTHAATPPLPFKPLAALAQRPPALQKPGLTQVADGLHGLQPMQTARNLRTRRLLTSGGRARSADARSHVAASSLTPRRSDQPPCGNLG